MMTKQFDKQVPLLLRVFENALRSGYSVVQALEILTNDLSDPARSDIQKVLDDLKTGTPLPQALDHWLARTPSEELNLIIAALRVQFEVGGNLADKFNLLAQIMNKRTNLQRI